MSEYVKKTRFCPKCGRELVYIGKEQLTGNITYTPCDYEPVPYWEPKYQGKQYVIRRVDGESIETRCNLDGDPGEVAGYAYAPHKFTCPAKETK